MISRHPRKTIDDQPHSTDHELSQDDAKEEGTALCIHAGASVFEDHHLDEPGQEDGEPDIVHDPAHAHDKADRVEGPPGQMVAGDHKGGHNQAPDPRPQPAGQARASWVGQFLGCKAGGVGGKGREILGMQV